MPGDNIKMKVSLIAPIAMEEGLRFAIREGGRTVGAGVVAKIFEMVVPRHDRGASSSHGGASHRCLCTERGPWMGSLRGKTYTPVAQLAEQWSPKPQVGVRVPPGVPFGQRWSSLRSTARQGCRSALRLQGGRLESYERKEVEQAAGLNGLDIAKLALAAVLLVEASWPSTTSATHPLVVRARTARRHCRGGRDRLCHRPWTCGARLPARIELRAAQGGVAGARGNDPRSVSSSWW